MLATCPFCELVLPLSEIQWHANIHIEENELASDREMAHKISLRPSSPILMCESTESAVPLEYYAEFVPKSDKIDSHFFSNNYGKMQYQDKISSLIFSQCKGKFHKVEGGLLCLLRSCLEKDTKKAISFVSTYIDHFESELSADFGWGCGWRNIQMLTSHLFTQRKEVHEVLFGGSGYVPDIPSLQRWLEIAWERGFDVDGSQYFNQKIYGSKRWIGTTECAALLRSFGLFARVVDFDSESMEFFDGNPKGKKRVLRGPIDKFIPRKQPCFSESFPAKKNVNGVAERSTTKHNNNVSEVLAKWVWKYFSSDVCSGSTSTKSNNVFVTQKTPLYFQYNGHSKTIVGIQKQKGSPGMLDEYTFLMFDPTQRTAAMEKTLRDNSGWKQVIKRGAHTLRKTQYQLCYVDLGIAKGAELEKLKKIDSILVRV